MLKESPLLQKQALSLKPLNDLFTQLQSLIESENFYQEVVNIIQSQFSGYCIQIWSVGNDKSLTLQAQAGAYRDHPKIGDTLKSARLGTGSDATLMSELCIPLLKNGEMFAVLTLGSDRKNAFDQSDVATLEAIASHVTVSLTNQRLYSEVKSFNKKLQQAIEEKTLELRRAHERILEQSRLLQRENKALKTLITQDNKVTEMIGKSSAILNVLSMVDKIAHTTATVLVQGESGTGKELIARRLHFKSHRDSGPYVTVNCGALQESLLESELFGHEKGSFTGAVAQKMGLCETADGGTLFLDEIGEISLGIQTKLLRFLQEGEFYRIGGKRPIRVNVRVVSATNRDLEREVKEGRFREDLFYRLNTITLKIPPLRKRKDDIPLLVDAFLKNSRFGGSTPHIKRIDPRVLEVFTNYSWPGNIRELQNTIERLKILAENNEICLKDIPFAIRVPKMYAESQDFSLELPLEDVEKGHILRTLAFNHGNKTKTAQSLGITIKTLYNKLHRYGILQTQGLSEKIDQNIESMSS